MICYIFFLTIIESIYLIYFWVILNEGYKKIINIFTFLLKYKIIVFTNYNNQSNKSLILFKLYLIGSNNTTLELKNMFVIIILNITLFFYNSLLFLINLKKIKNSFIIRLFSYKVVNTI